MNSCSCSVRGAQRSGLPMFHKQCTGTTYKTSERQTVPKGTYFFNFFTLFLHSFFIFFFTARLCGFVGRTMVASPHPMLPVDLCVSLVLQSASFSPKVTGVAFKDLLGRVSAFDVRSPFPHPSCRTSIVDSSAGFNATWL